MHASIWGVIGVAATLCGGSAISVTPKILRSLRRRRAVQDRLLGKPAVTDKNGTEIAAKVPSVHEEIAALRQDLLARPALNGQFNQLVTDMAHMKEWAVDHSAAHAQAQR